MQSFMARFAKRASGFQSSCMIVIGYGSKLWYPGERQNNWQSRIIAPTYGYNMIGLD